MQHEDHVEVEQHSQEGLSLEVERTQCPEEGRYRKVNTKTKKGIPLLLPRHRSGRGLCVGAFLRAKVNQIGIHRAWGSPPAPLSDEVYLSGPLHAIGSTAVDLARGPL